MICRAMNFMSTDVNILFITMNQVRCHQTCVAITRFALNIYVSTIENRLMQYAPAIVLCV